MEQEQNFGMTQEEIEYWLDGEKESPFYKRMKAEGQTDAQIAWWLKNCG